MNAFYFWKKSVWKFPTSDKNQNISFLNKICQIFISQHYLDSTLVGDVENHTINKGGHYLILKENSTSHEHNS